MQEIESETSEGKSPSSTTRLVITVLEDSPTFLYNKATKETVVIKVKRYKGRRFRLVIESNKTFIISRTYKYLKEKIDAISKKS